MTTHIIMRSRNSFATPPVLCSILLFHIRIINQRVEGTTFFITCLCLSEAKGMTKIMKTEYHILFTGVGRRVELIQAFRQASLDTRVSIKIYGADMTDTAPALAYCDYTRIVCGMRDEKYVPELLDICMMDKIDLLIPTIDTDLLILSKNKEQFERIGTKVLISSQEMIAICRDKRFTTDFFERCGVFTPHTYDDVNYYKDSFPCFIKPKDGSSSINAYKVTDKDELFMYSEQVEDYIIQPFIEGKEYTVDIFCDFEGNPIYIVPRQRLAIRSGEVLKTKIDLDEKIIKESKKIIERFKPCGPMTVQLIRENGSNRDYFIEINPRFGGGAPLSMKAGADSAAVVLRLLNEENMEYSNCNVSNDSEYSRFDQSVCVFDGGAIEMVRGVVFDLDDTLYSEKDYVRSGYRAVAEWIGDSKVEHELWHYFNADKQAIDEVLTERGLLEKKSECLNIYRNHIPNIKLYEGVEQVIRELKEKDIKVGIITDGRVEGQKNKINALGLNSLVDDIIITDELGGIQFRKPNDIAFRIMQCRWRIPFQNMVYVGDNMSKDFQAPRQLGMKSIFVNNENGIYASKCNDRGKINIVPQVSGIRDLFW